MPVQPILDRLNRGAPAATVLRCLQALWELHLVRIEEIIRALENPIFEGATFLVNLQPVDLDGVCDVVLRLPDGLAAPPPGPPFLPVFTDEDLSEYVSFYPGPVATDGNYYYDPGVYAAKRRHPQLLRVVLERLLPDQPAIPPAGPFFLIDLADRVRAEHPRADRVCDNLKRLVRYAHFHPLSCHLHHPEAGAPGEEIDPEAEDQEAELRAFLPGGYCGPGLYVRCPDPGFITYLLTSDDTREVFCAAPEDFEPLGEQVYPARRIAGP